MSLYRLEGPLPSLDTPIVIAAMDGWVDAGSAASGAIGAIAAGAVPVAAFDADQLYDYRSRRPTLEIIDGRPSSLAWPALVLRHTRVAGRDILVLSGAEPDDRWHALADAVVELLGRLDVAGWISLGAIPAAVPHTRPVPILGTESRPGLLRGGVGAAPIGLLKVPAAALSMLEMAAAAGGIPAVGYFAQIPHYVTGPYATAAVALLRAVERHLDVELPRGDLADQAQTLRVQLDTAAAADESTNAYVGRLEAMVDEARQPEGDDLITEIERFLRDRSGGEG
jgi:hypothetical protein